MKHIYNKKIKIAFIGDLHGEFHALDIIYQIEKPDVLIQCGDFGVWPHFEKDVISDVPVPVYFCRGNHEHHDLLDTFPKFEISNLHSSERVIDTRLKKYRNMSITDAYMLSKTNFPKSNIHLADTGSILTLNDKNILFIGGASSIDKHHRNIGTSWWPQELLTNEQKKYIMSLKEKIDIIVSHTAPSFITKQIVGRYSNKFSDETCEFLDKAFAKFNPEKWYFGHFHEEREFKFNNTEFYCLDMFTTKYYHKGFPEINKSLYTILEI